MVSFNGAPTVRLHEAKGIVARFAFYIAMEPKLLIGLYLFFFESIESFGGE